MTDEAHVKIQIESQNDNRSDDIAGVVPLKPMASANTSSDHENLITNEEQVTKLSSDDDESGYTQLHQACINGNCKEVDELLRKKAVDVNATDKDGCTPLHCACKIGNEGIVKLLIEKGADSCIFSHERRTPLH
ncbi:PREDICTED: 26S proteasome non-ATPase regulatory subunit 10-like, partial [Amphimedon queenslandica]|uniref:Uncharacterized protein n=1 Tax=Amphimedon queenslandica TaxID=400682 RepID=A0AAN0JNQ2_AMPQE